MFAVAEFTFKKMKEPSYIIMLLFAILLGYFVCSFESVSAAAADKDASSIVTRLLLTQGAGAPLLASSFFSIGLSFVIGIFTAASDIPRDIESRMIMLIIGKPISRFDYLLGKYLGILAVTLLMFFAIEASIVVSYYFKHHEWYTANVIGRQCLLALALPPLIALTVAISTFVGDIGAMIFTVIYISFSISVSIIPMILALLPESMTVDVQSYILVIYYMFPNFLYFFQGFQFNSLMTFATTVYAVSLSIMFLGVAAVRVKNRDMTQ